MPRTILKQNQYGVSAGGPIRNNRHFIFGNWEGSRVRQGTGPFASNAPTAEQRAGLLRYRANADDPAPSATLDLSNRVNPITRRILDGFIPLPNTAGGGTLYIANPDLVERFRRDAPLNEPDPSTFYGGDEHGYTDYPALSG